MRPLLHPMLVNGRYGDPALYVETLFEKHAVLFDLGEITSLSPRKIHRIDRIFVSHAHIDHLVGFDHILRLLVGRGKTLQLYGPSGFAERIYHKLQGYSWNLSNLYRNDLVLVVNEVVSLEQVRKKRFRLKNAFVAEEFGSHALPDGVLHRGSNYRIYTVILDHRVPCLGFALRETTHVNVWKPRLLERGLTVGPWLRELKRAFVECRPDDYPINVEGAAAASSRQLPLGELRDLLTATSGQKIAYVTDVADTQANRRAIVELALNADLLFIEAAFAKADAALAADRAHLTTEAAGRIARAAGVRRVEPFHFSARYKGQEQRMMREVSTAFAGCSVE